MSAHILVVDDDPDIRALIVQLLMLEGFEVATAANGQAALDHIAVQEPQLVLLDLQMPLMSGWEVLAHLRQARPAVPVVFMSAGYRAEVEAKRHGADGYLAKPFDLDAVLALIARYTVPPPR